LEVFVKAIALMNKLAPMTRYFYIVMAGVDFQDVPLNHELTAMFQRHQEIKIYNSNLNNNIKFVLQMSHQDNKIEDAASTWNLVLNNTLRVAYGQQ
jgi:hypothetical protein